LEFKADTLAQEIREKRVSIPARLVSSMVSAADAGLKKLA